MFVTYVVVCLRTTSIPHRKFYWGTCLGRIGIECLWHDWATLNIYSSEKLIMKWTMIWDDRWIVTLQTFIFEVIISLIYLESYTSCDISSISPWGPRFPRVMVHHGLGTQSHWLHGNLIPFHVGAKPLNSVLESSSAVKSNSSEYAFVGLWTVHRYNRMMCPARHSWFYSIWKKKYDLFTYISYLLSIRNIRMKQCIF